MQIKRQYLGLTGVSEGNKAYIKCSNVQWSTIGKDKEILWKPEDNMYVIVAETIVEDAYIIHIDSYIYIYIYTYLYLSTTEMNDLRPIRTTLVTLLHTNIIENVRKILFELSKSKLASIPSLVAIRQ